MATTAPKVLVIDDEASIRSVMALSLKSENLEVFTAASGQEGMAIARAHTIDLILLDLRLPDMDGFEFFERLQLEPKGSDIPVILLTGENSAEVRERGFALGIEDFLAKPFDISELRSRVAARLRSRQQLEAIVSRNDAEQRKVTDEIREVQDRFSALTENSFDLIGETDHNGRYIFLSPNHEEILGYEPEELIGHSFFENIDPQDRGEVVSKYQFSLASMESHSGIFRYQHQTGEWRWLETTAKPFITASGNIHFVLVSRDITQRIANERRLAFLATHDSLTGLWNRNHFTQHLRRVMEDRRKEATHAMLYLDMDNFKIINDTVGHAAGDRLLIAIAEMLRSHIQNQGLAARFGGDEFVVFFENITFERAQTLCENLRLAIDNFRFGDSDRIFDVSASMGLVAIQLQTSSEEVLAQADSACYDAKKKGRNRLEVFQPQDSELMQLVDDSNWASRIRHALRHKLFEIWFQPIQNIRSHVVERYEVLVRMRDDSGQYIAPNMFIPPAERFGIMPQLDQHILTEAVSYMARFPELQLSINLSGTSLNDPDLPKFIDQLFAQSQVSPHRITFEITETAYITNLIKAQGLLEKLRGQGFRFALDDFGCGFSSLSYLRNLPVDYIKIDGSFVRGLHLDKLNQTLIKSITEVAHLLDKKTVAEFVEDQATFDILKSIGVDYIQGHFLGKASPSPTSELNTAAP